MLIYMIRHGQTDWNAEGRLQGQKDIPLNATGRAQAAGNGRALAALLGPTVSDYDFIASPLARTRQTMELARAAMGLAPHDYATDPRLVEISFGDWEGYTLADIARAAPERLEERTHSKWDFIPPGQDAESYEILSWRVGSWLKSLTRPTVCVSHGGVIRSVFRLVGGYDIERAATTDIPQDRILRIDMAAPAAAWLEA